MISELIIKNRSYRRFHQTEITRAELKKMVTGARNSASAANLQRIRYLIVNDRETVSEIFPTLMFAGYLKEWGGPLPSERPTAYIVLMTEKTPDVNLAIDIGIAAQSMLLVGAEMGIGGCMIRSFKREELSSVIKVDGYSPELVIALGHPSERVYITDAENGDIKYYRDGRDDHAVPKLSLDELIIKSQNR